MIETICITCPIGCHVTAKVTNGEYIFSGNKCPKGEEFSKIELAFPAHSLTTTVRTVFPDTPVLAVKTRGGVPRERIAEIIRELSKVVVTKKIVTGETVAANILGTGCDIIATCDMN